MFKIIEERSSKDGSVHLAWPGGMERIEIAEGYVDTLWQDRHVNTLAIRVVGTDGSIFYERKEA